MNTGMTMYENQSKQAMKVRLAYHGNNKFKPTGLFPTTNLTS